MYSKDKRQRITLRVSDEQFEAVKLKADILGISPSDFIRMLINSVLYTDRKMKKVSEEVLGRENDETDSDDII